MRSTDEDLRRSLRERRAERRDRPAGWDDPFDGYGSVAEDDDLGLAGLREAARAPMTPISGAGRSAAPRAVPGAPRGPDQQDEQAGQRVDVEH